MRRRLRDHNLPTPKTVTLRHPGAWTSVLQSSLKFPLVVKPVDASHANGSTFNIMNEKELQRAVTRAFEYIKKNKKKVRVLVEEFVEGKDLRLLVVGSKVVSVVTREPAYIIGDGHNTVRSLIRTFNEGWKSTIKYDFPQCPIPIDSEVSRYLARTNRTLNSIPKEGEKVQLRWNANVSTGGRAIDITDQVNPLIKAQAVEIARIAQLEIGGVDILCKDITSSDISQNNIAILEINDSPGVDIHHYPFKGNGRNVSSDILEHIFKKPEIQEAVSVAKILKDLKVVAPNAAAYHVSSNTPSKEVVGN